MDVFVLSMPEPLDNVYVSNFQQQCLNMTKQTSQLLNVDSVNSTDLKDLSINSRQTTRIKKNNNKTEKKDSDEKDSEENENPEEKDSEEKVLEENGRTEQYEETQQDNTHHEINLEQSKNKYKQSSTPLEIELDRTHEATTPIVEEPIPNTLSRSEVQTIATMMASLPDTPASITALTSTTQPGETGQKSKSVEKKKKTLKVADLRRLCEDNNLETFGLKEVLIKRLEKHNLL